MRVRLAIWFAIPICLMGAACGGSSPAPAPTAPTAPPAPANPAFTLSGRVIDGASGRPIEGALVSLQLQVAPGLLQGTASDASGRYRVSWPQPGWDTTAFVGAIKNNEYVQPCASTVKMDRDGTLDIHLVSRTSLAAQLSLTGASNTRSVSGVIFRTTAAGRQTVDGAWVAFEWWSDSPFAFTTSDWMGRYRLCGLPIGQAIDIYAVQRTEGSFDPQVRPSHEKVEPGPDAVVDIELK